MSTTIGFVIDAVDPSYSVEVYTGTGGVALLIHSPSPLKSSKIWLDREGIEKLVELLRVSTPHGLPEKDGE